MIEGNKKESPVFPGGSDCKELPAMWETQVRSLAWEDPLEESMATHYSSLAWIILWTEEPGGLQSMGFQRVRHNWTDTFRLGKNIQNISDKGLYSKYKKKSFNSFNKKTNNPLTGRQKKTWTGISQKKINRWQIRAWTDSQHHKSSRKWNYNCDVITRHPTRIALIKNTDSSTHRYCNDSPHPLLVECGVAQPFWSLYHSILQS